MQGGFVTEPMSGACWERLCWTSCRGESGWAANPQAVIGREDGAVFNFDSSSSEVDASFPGADLPRLPEGLVGSCPSRHSPC